MLFESDESVLFTPPQLTRARTARTRARDATTNVRRRHRAAAGVRRGIHAARGGFRIDLVIAIRSTRLLLVKGGEEDDIAWDDSRLHRHASSTTVAYQPYAYEIVNEPAV